MMSLGQRVVGVLAIVLFLLLLPFLFATVVAAAVVLVVLAVVAGLVFYFRMRMVLRRYRAAFEVEQKRLREEAQAREQAARREQAGVLDAEFTVHDET